MKITDDGSYRKSTLKMKQYNYVLFTSKTNMCLMFYSLDKRSHLLMDYRTVFIIVTNYSWYHESTFGYDFFYFFLFSSCGD